MSDHADTIRRESWVAEWREIEPAASAVVARGAMRITEAHDVLTALMIGDKLTVEVESLRAERQQLQEELHHRDAQIQDLCDDLHGLLDQRQQAIDALREIERLSRPTGPANALHPPGRVEIGSLRQASGIARDTLVKLGEQP